MDLAIPHPYLRIKAGRLVFSSCDARLSIERARKKAEMSAFNSNKWCSFTTPLELTLVHRNKSMGAFACPLKADKAQNTECHTDSDRISDCILGFSAGAARAPAPAGESA